MLNIQTVPSISILACVIFIALILSATDANENQAAVQDHYCEMRAIFKATDSKYGWPKLDGYGECK
jgi:hypothetical protein